MPRDIPVAPVSGTVITSAWAISSDVNPINWLYGLTGSANPPAAGYSIDSVSTTATTWVQKVSRAGDTMTNDLQVNRTALSTPTLGYLVLGNNTSFYFGFDGSQHVLSTPQLSVTGEVILGNNIGLSLGGNSGATRGRLYDSPGSLTVLRTHNDSFGVYTNNLGTLIFGADNAAAAPTFKGNAVWHAGNDTRIGVPLGAVVWFRTLAELTAAGASWTRETLLDGRLPIGAGTTFGQTFVDGLTGTSNYGANWTPAASVVGPTNTGNVTGGFGNAGAGAAILTPDHNHTMPALTGTTTAWIPPARAGIFARRI